MYLGFGGTGTDSPPAHQISHVLRRDHVEEFGSGWQPHVVEIEQQLATQAQTVIDLAAVIEVRIVDEPLPAHGSTRFFEVDPHHDLQLAFQLVAQRLEALAIFDGGNRIMNGTGANDHQQTVIFTIQDTVDGLTGIKHGR